MKINAIIAEYNPLHKGHEYLINYGKEITGADYTRVERNNGSKMVPASTPASMTLRSLNIPPITVPVSMKFGGI